MEKKGVPLGRLGVAAPPTIVFLASLYLAVWSPRRAAERIAANEKAAEELLLVLADAEYDFWIHDRDQNHVHDFWVGDLGGLYRYGSLKDLSLAQADGRPLIPLSEHPIPKKGYYFVAMEFTYGSESGTMVPLGMDTDGTGQRVRNRRSFGFSAYPAQYGVTGSCSFIVNEERGIFAFDTGGLPLIRWPFDELKLNYDKLD